MVIAKFVTHLNVPFNPTGIHEWLTLMGDAGRQIRPIKMLGDTTFNRPHPLHASRLNDIDFEDVFRFCPVFFVLFLFCFWNVSVLLVSKLITFAVQFRGFLVHSAKVKRPAALRRRGA
jgi:hypothetical protein